MIVLARKCWPLQPANLLPLSILQQLMSNHINYEQLLQKLGQPNDEARSDCLRKLVYLSVNDSTTFRRFARRIAQLVNASLQDMFQQDTKLLALQLLSELVTSYRTSVSKSTLELGGVVVCLSDQKVFRSGQPQLQIRKASHYLIMTFVKKYEKFDEVLNSYRRVGETSSVSWKLIQKIIHSFESLVIHQPKCITYSQDYRNMDSFLTFVIRRGADDNSLLKKASEQAMTSFVKNEYTPQILPKLNNWISQTLIGHSKAVGVKLPEPEEDVLEEVNITDREEKREVYSPRVSVTPTANVDRKSSQLRLNVPDSTSNEDSVSYQLNSLLERVECRNQWSVKCQAMDQLHRLMISQSMNKVPELLVERVMDLTSDLNFKTCITSLNAIHYIVTECFDSAKPFLRSIQEITIEKICDSKLAIRQVAGKIAKELVCNNKSKNLVKALLQKLVNCSLLGKEEIIALVQDIYTREGGILDDSLNVISELATLLYNENTKIKMKAIEALVKISLTCDLEECKRVLVKKLNKVYYDMFLERLKERPVERWQDNKNKGSSYQVEKSPAFTFEKPFCTKKQGGSFVEGTKKRQQEDTLSINSKPENETFFYESKTTNKTMSSTNTETISASCKTKGYSEGKSTISTNFGEFTTTSVSAQNAPIAQNGANHEQKVSLIVRNKYSGAGCEEDEKKTKEVGAYQYKPVLSRKPPLSEQKKDRITQEPYSNSGDKLKEDNLIVESRQYRFKRPAEEQRPKEDRKSNIKLTKPFSNKRQPERVEEDADQEEKKQLSKPFTKKSSKNEPRVIDYKQTQYISKEELKPFDNYDYALKQISTEIRKEEDWSTHFESLNSIRRLLKHHPQAYPGLVSSLPTTMAQVLKLVESLRSSLAKNAMITLAEMCESLKRNMDPYLQMIFMKLFRKGLDTNSFINDEVKKCLTSLCSYCTQNKVVPVILNHCQTKQNQVKLYILLCIQKITDRFPNNRLQILKEYNRLASIMGSYIMDSSAEVRGCCKSLFCLVVRQSSKMEVQGLFRRNTTEQAFIKLKGILDKEVLATDMVVKSTSKKGIDFD